MSPHSERSEAPEGICRCSSVQNGGLPDKSGADFAGSEDPTCPNCRQIWISSSSTSGSADLVLKSERDWERFRRLIEAAGKGFAIGTGIKGGLAVFSILARLRSRRFLNSSRKVGLMTNSEAIVKATKETLRYGLFLGTFAGTFVSVDELIAALGGHSRTASWRALLAGAIAGPSMLLTGTNTQHTSLAIYILMRAAVLASRCGIKSKQIGSICKPLTWIHGDIFLMCLSSSQILSSYILKQDSLPLAYKSFLNKHGGKDLVILQGVKDIASGVHLTNLKGIENYYSSIGVDIKLDPEMKVPCTIVHGNQSCTGHFFSFLFEAYKRALPVYIPVYLIPALIVHRKGLLKRFFTIQKGRLGRDCSINHLIICDTGCSPLTELEIYTWLLHLSRRPYTILGKNVLGTTRSSLFLSVYCSSAWIWTCLLFRLFKRCNVPMVAMGTFPTGLALLIEKKSRRIEISLYCFARAIESFFTCISDAGYLPHAKRFKRADVALFSVSTAIIMHCYAQERDVFRSKYLNVLDWVFGVPPTCVKCDSSENNNVHNS